MELGFITEHYMPIVVIACMIIGYCIKHIIWLEKISNQYIPLILSVSGAVLGCVANSSISLDTVVYGALSGLASTGLHQAFTRIIESGIKEGNDKTK
ncbi:phage holin family protein [Robinsoniella peoriensis]|uniref:phage holin family protein n=1 Tax=Robinsoniella peoriensis TaxID=180332 RepID=UPI00085C277F|nr:phage holin family protein [Robinsoniella peoriensis]